MPINNRIQNTRPFGTRIAIKRAACLMMLFSPMLGWAQSDGKVVPVTENGHIELTKTASAANQSTTREINLPQVLDRLALNAPQQSLWEFFKGKVDAYTSAYYRQKPIVPSVEDAAPRQIGRMVDNLQNRLAALEEVESAAKNLYTSLTPEQQRTANELLILTIPTFVPSSGESISSTAVKCSNTDTNADPRIPI
jgi:hypothetical protein